VEAIWSDDGMVFQAFVAAGFVPRGDGSLQRRSERARDERSPELGDAQG
jgi:hypothetical protein